jgi:hypothetical protein
MCIDIVLESVDMYSVEKSIPEIRSYIESKYGDIGPPTITPLTLAEADISKTVLPKNFDSISDGLRLTPAGIIWAQFINVKLVQGTSLEPYARNRDEPDSFYWKRIVGMYSADYSENSWIELHDLGVGATVKPRRFQGMDNVVSTRPFVFGHAENVEKVLRIFENPEAYPTAYETFKSVLENVKDDEAGNALVLVDPSVFADLAYLSLRETADGTVEKIVVYRVSNISAINMTEYEERAATAKERGFTHYEVKKVGDLRDIKMVGDIGSVLNENFKHLSVPSLLIFLILTLAPPGTAAEEVKVDLYIHEYCSECSKYINELTREIIDIHGVAVGVKPIISGGNRADLERIYSTHSLADELKGHPTMVINNRTIFTGQVDTKMVLETVRLAKEQPLS